MYSEARNVGFKYSGLYVLYINTLINKQTKNAYFNIAIKNLKSTERNANEHDQRLKTSVAFFVFIFAASVHTLGRGGACVRTWINYVHTKYHSFSLSRWSRLNMFPLNYDSLISGRGKFS